MKTDTQLLSDIQAELKWDPSVDDRGIVASVKDGVVTLAGHVGSYTHKWSAEKAVKAIAGVRAIANEIDVKLGSAQRADKEIAEAAASVLKSHVSIPAADIQAIVNDGWITLEGKVALGYQRSAAEAAVRNLYGIKGVTNNIEIKSQAKVKDVKAKIQQAFQRHAALDAKHVTVDVADDTITLSGEVSSWAERDEAETAAWAAPGVTRVQNQLAIRA